MHFEGRNTSRESKSNKLRPKSTVRKTVTSVANNDILVARGYPKKPTQKMNISRMKLKKLEIEQRNLLSKFTNAGNSDQLGYKSSHRILPNTCFRTLSSKSHHNPPPRPDGDGSKNKILPGNQSDLNVSSSRRASKNDSKIRLKQFKSKRSSKNCVPLPLSNFHKKEPINLKTSTEVDIQTSCLINYFAKSCQTLRQSQIDVLNMKQLLERILEKIQKNPWGYEFTFVIFQTAAETLNMKSLKINKKRKSSISIARLMKKIENLDDLWKFDDDILQHYETKELLDILSWLLNDSKLEITGTIEITKIRELMIKLDENEQSLLPQAMFEVSYHSLAHSYQQWLSLRRENIDIINCYMFISPTKIYKYLRHGFSKRSSKQYVAFQNHLPFLEEETENFLVWNIMRSNEEDELIMVAVVNMINERENFDETIFHDQIMYKIKNPESLVIKHVLLYSRKHYQVYLDNCPVILKQQKYNFSLNSVNRSTWTKVLLAIIALMVVPVLVLGTFRRSNIESNENKFRGEGCPSFALIDYLLYQG